MKNNVIKSIGFLLLGIAILISCNKNNHADVPKQSQNHIDVSKQWQFDYSGNLISSQPDSQWQNRSFTQPELDLFQSLDTVNLAGTTKPDSAYFISIFPNPFTTQQMVYFRSDGYAGSNFFKYFIVDTAMAVHAKGEILLHGPFTTFILTNNLSVGKYRIYYTLSAQGNEHFFKTWGNIEKAQ